MKLLLLFTYRIRTSKTRYYVIGSQHVNKSHLQFQIGKSIFRLSYIFIDISLSSIYRYLNLCKLKFLLSRAPKSKTNLIPQEGWRKRRFTDKVWEINISNRSSSFFVVSKKKRGLSSKMPHTKCESSRAI